MDGRSVGFRRDAWAAAGGFPEHLRTAEDEAFGRAVLATGARSALTLDAEVTWHQRPTVAATFQQFRGYGKGGGASRSPLLLGRDAARVLAYAGLGIAATKGGVTGKVLAAAGAAAYLSLPVSRVIRRGQSPLLLPLLPAALLLKDVAKVVGTAEALLGGLRRQRPAPAVDPTLRRPRLRRLLRRNRWTGTCRSPTSWSHCPSSRCPRTSRWHPAPASWPGDRREETAPPHRTFGVSGHTTDARSPVFPESPVRSVTRRRRVLGVLVPVGLIGGDRPRRLGGRARDWPRSGNPAVPGSPCWWWG